jgi:exodeoxyribonuclease VII large subunit
MLAIGECCFNCSNSVLNFPCQRTLSQQQLNLFNLTQSLRQAMHHSLERQKYKLATHSAGLHHLEPLNTLSPGYSISMLENNQVLDSVAQVKIGTLINTRLGDGKICALNMVI